MGGFGGHINMGLGFLAIGLWHIFNHIRGHRLHPPLPWFPVPKVRHLELYLIMLASFAFTISELRSVMRSHPLDQDGTIPFHHLHKVEHLTISLSLLTYAALSILFDKLAVSSTKSRARVFYDMTHLLAAIAFGLELFLFHFHSADHMGLEGHYHLLFQIVVMLSFTTTLIGIAEPGNFMVSFVRSVSILFQGVWTIIIGYMLWTPQFIPKGCWMDQLDNREYGREYMVRCDSDHALHRAKSLATILFSFIVIGITVFSVLPFIAVPNIYEDTVKYRLCTPDVDRNDTNPKNKPSKSHDNDYERAPLVT